jgi:hypothetical protein
MSTPKKSKLLPQKTTLLKLRRGYNKNHVDNEITSYDLAKVAGVATTDVYAVEIGAVIDTETAQKVLNTFNALTKQNYPLEAITFTPRCVYPRSVDRMGRPIQS